MSMKQAAAEIVTQPEGNPTGFSAEVYKALMDCESLEIARRRGGVRGTRSVWIIAKLTKQLSAILYSESPHREPWSNFKVLALDCDRELRRFRSVDEELELLRAKLDELD